MLTLGQEEILELDIEGMLKVCIWVSYDTSSYLIMTVERLF